MIFDILNQKVLPKQQLTFYKLLPESPLTGLVGNSNHENKGRMNLWQTLGLTGSSLLMAFWLHRINKASDPFLVALFVSGLRLVD